MLTKNIYEVETLDILHCICSIISTLHLTATTIRASVLTFESSETHAEKHTNVKECTGGGTSGKQGDIAVMQRKK